MTPHHEQRSLTTSPSVSGIGRSTCVALAKRGYPVIIADIDEENGAKVVKEVEAVAEGARAAFVKLDVTNEAQWKNAGTYVGASKVV